jgi:hypothetical protein
MDGTILKKCSDTFVCVVHFRWIIQIELKSSSAKFFLPLSWMIAFDEWTLDTVPKSLNHTYHAPLMPCRANSHMPHRNPPMLQHCRVFRECSRNSRKYPNC